MLQSHATCLCVCEGGRCLHGTRFKQAVFLAPPASQSLLRLACLPRRYEVNPEMVSKIEQEGLLFVGRDETGERMEVVELQENPTGHPFYVAAQVGQQPAQRHPSFIPISCTFVILCWQSCAFVSLCWQSWDVWCHMSSCLDVLHVISFLHEGPKWATGKHSTR